MTPPFPGGRLGPGHYIGVGGGDFTIGPFSFTGFSDDTTQVGPGGAASVVTRFRGNSAIPASNRGLLQINPVNSGTLVSAPNQPNFHVDAGGSGAPVSFLNDFGIQLFADMGPDPISLQPGNNPPVIGAVFRLNAQRDYKIVSTGTPPLTRENTSVYRIVSWTDPTDVRAQATITRRFTRLP